MRESDQAASPSGEPTTASIDEGDFSLEKIRSVKLVELRSTFEELFGLARLLPYAAAGLGGSFLFFLGAWALIFLPPSAPLISTLAFIYMLLQGLFLGVFAAALLVGAGLLQQLTAVLSVSIRTIKEMLHEIRSVESDPGLRAELFSGLLHGAVLPAAQGVITVKLGLIRAPISFVLNRVLKRAFRILTRSMVKKDKKLLKEASPLPETLSDAPPLSQESEKSKLSTGLTRSETHLDRLQDHVETLARRTRRATLIPAAILLVFSALFSSIPWLLSILAI